jgi:hypothetical protein
VPITPNLPPLLPTGAQVAEYPQVNARTTDQKVRGSDLVPCSRSELARLLRLARVFEVDVVGGARPVDGMDEEEAALVGGQEQR